MDSIFGPGREELLAKYGAKEEESGEQEEGRRS